MPKHSKKFADLDPAFMARQRASLLRRHRQTVFLNDQELSALNEYCTRMKITSKSAVMRRILMERILKELDENHPTLF